MSTKLRFSFLFVLVLSLASAGYSEPGTIMLDFDKTGDVNTEPNFTSFLMSDSGTEVNGITIDLAGDINDARRATPESASSGIPVYNEELYRDFVYGMSPSGITITLGGLGINQECDITIYAYDDESSPNRVADWTANGSYLLTTNFSGGDAFAWPSPWWGIEYKFGPETATADEYGRIVLESTRNPASPEGEDFAFVNALVVVPTGTYLPVPCAQHPVPSNGKEDVPVNTNLQWRAGAYADTHDVYLGTNFNDVNDASRSTPLGVLLSQDQTTTNYNPPGFLDSGTTYYWRIDEVNDANIWKGMVWSFTTHVPVACNPVPLDSAIAVPTDVNLMWEKGEYAEMHDVYFGTDEAKVTDANRSNPLGVLVSENQSAATYDPPESLSQSTTYYWRIDEVNGTNIWKGELWSFRTTGPYFGLEPPGMVPEIFAPGFISLPGRFERAPNFYHDGKEFYFTIILPDHSDQDIYYSICDANGQWSEPQEIYFSVGKISADVSLTSDGNRMCFTSNEGKINFWDNDIWVSERVGGWWAEPTILSETLNTTYGEWGPCLLNNGTVYFARTFTGSDSEIYRSRFIDGAYETPVPVPGVNATGSVEYDQTLPEDESYMIFKSNRPGGYGINDLYVSFNNDGTWSTPKNLGPTINTPNPDDCGGITPDGKYFIFARRNGDVEMDIYWVDARAIFPAGDFTRNGKVDFDDLSVLAAHWLTDDPSLDIAPETPDGIINFLDFAAFARHWLEDYY